MKKILALTRYGSIGPSSRYRFYQYFPFFEKNNMQIIETPFFGDDYTKTILSNNEKKFRSNSLFSFFNRIEKLLNAKNIDAFWIEKELLPWLPSKIENLFLNVKIPIITDYDDAIFHRYDEHTSFFIRFFLSQKIEKIMQKSTLVIAGNKYIADYAKSSGVKKIEIIPTSINTNKIIKSAKSNSELFRIGWIGSASTSKHINEVSDVLKFICKDDKILFKAIGANKKYLYDIPVEILPWIEKKEVEEISNFDVGIMPLPNSSWEKGKCGLKLIQYMSCGLPVIASPIGMNKEIIDHGKNGFLAKNFDEWVKYLLKLKNNPELRYKMGQEGLRKVRLNYSIDNNSSRLINIFKQVLSI